MFTINYWSFSVAGIGIKNRNAKANAASSRWEYQEAPRDAPEQGDGWAIACNFFKLP